VSERLSAGQCDAIGRSPKSAARVPSKPTGDPSRSRTQSVPTAPVPRVRRLSRMTRTAMWWVRAIGSPKLSASVDLPVPTSPALVAVKGVGTETAAALLVAAGDNPERLRSEAAFAHLCGVAPIPCSSGKTTRHRLNRGGNREANWALYLIAVGRMAWHGPTHAYVDRRTKEGKSKAEIIRCLKRHIARELYSILVSGRPLDEP